MLESCARVTIGRRRWNSYFVCGVAGYLVGLALATWLGARAGFGAPARLAIAVVPPAVLLVTIRIVAAIVGSERIVFYEKALAAVGTGAAAAWLAGAPFLAALDVVMLGVGAFLALGRIGCFRVGCCYGRPWRHGVRYGHDHVAAGFPPRLRGVALAPIQLVDGALAAALTGLGIAFVVGSAAPGHAAAAWIAGYAVGRFTLELARGDERPTWRGLSEAQWTAIATAWLAVAAWPHAAIVACAAATSIAGGLLLVARRRGWLVAYWLSRPAHLRELDDLLAARATTANGAPVVTTERLRLSVHALGDGALDVVASHADRALAPAVARRLAGQLGRRWRLLDVIAARTPGLVHVVLRQDG